MNTRTAHVISALDATGQTLIGIGSLIQVAAKLYTSEDIIDSNSILAHGFGGTEGPGDVAELVETEQLQDVPIALGAGHSTGAS